MRFVLCYNFSIAESRIRAWEKVFDQYFLMVLDYGTTIVDKIIIMAYLKRCCLSCLALLHMKCVGLIKL